MLLALIIFLLIFSFLVLSHEFGHFVVARRLGIKVEEFGIGYPPRVFAKKIKGMVYSINWIPFGGFVKIYGENAEKGTLDDPESFINKPPRVKAAALLAGVAANFLVAIIIFYFLLGFHGFQTHQAYFFDYQFPFGKQENFAAISHVVEGSPGDLAGIKPFDLVLAGNNQKLKDSDEVMSFISENKGKEISFLLKNIHSGEERLLKVVPRVEPPKEEGAVGIALGDVSQLTYESAPEKVFSGFLHCLNIGHFSFRAMGYLIKTSIVQKDIEPVSSAVSGPVGILAFTKLSMAGGAWQIFYLIAAISLALAIVNILPIPAADGGRLVFVLYEAIFRKRAPAKLERNVNLVGFFILIALLLLVTLKDILQFKDILF